MNTKHIQPMTTPAPASLRCSIAAIFAGKGGDGATEFHDIMAAKGCDE